MVNHRGSFPWHPEHVQEATLRYYRGETGSMIAKALSKHGSLTRMAVIGKLRRLGVIRDDIVVAEKLKPHRINPKVHVVKHVRRTEAPAAKPDQRGRADASVIALNSTRWAERRDQLAEPPSPRLNAFLPTAQDMIHARPFSERINSECKWPFGEGEHTLSCCRPVERGGYCQHHADRAFQGDGRKAQQVLKQRDLRRYA